MIPLLELLYLLTHQSDGPVVATVNLDAEVAAEGVAVRVSVGRKGAAHQLVNFSS